MQIHIFDQGSRKSACHRYVITEQEKEKRKKAHVDARTKLYTLLYYSDVIKKETNWTCLHFTRS
jgi:hypothetical protein